MSKKTARRKKKEQSRGSLRQGFWILAVVGGALLVIVAGYILAQRWSGAGTQEADQDAGAPRLMVNQTEIDEGYSKYDVPVRTAFRLSNVGDGPLQIIETPQVRLVDGC